MTNHTTWARRVAEWRASGLSMRRFCRDRDFTASGLYYWMRKLEEASPAPQVALARVVRKVREPLASTRSDDPARPTGRVVVAVGNARVEVAPGVERATLATVLELLGARVATEAR